MLRAAARTPPSLAQSCLYYLGSVGRKASFALPWRDSQDESRIPADRARQKQCSGKMAGP